MIGRQFVCVLNGWIVRISETAREIRHRQSERKCTLYNDVKVVIWFWVLNNMVPMVINLYVGKSTVFEVYFPLLFPVVTTILFSV